MEPDDDDDDGVELLSTIQQIKQIKKDEGSVCSDLKKCFIFN